MKRQARMCGRCPQGFIRGDTKTTLCEECRAAAAEVGLDVVGGHVVDRLEEYAETS